ncbi:MULTISPECIES: MAG0110 family membrane protein [unclassified Mycoplasma]|uniref:MAG0110 family membrane protein n=1 Tax=unclassified Mycoplasma TaxID=2683645 RepID=UPI00216B269D|nr:MULTISPECIES: hypothetical protein [unclassified Mycoplasma]MCS4536711.1 hypothetical protein [Mycoplasma sp. CSL7475-4]MCT4469802.1 hypothetical protein [Mycoplasma sp. HS2188]
MNIKNNFKTRASGGNRIIAGSLLTFAIGLIFAIIGAITFTTTVKYLPQSIFSFAFLLTGSIINFILVMVIMLVGPKMKAYVLGPLASISMFLVGYFVLSYVFYFSKPSQDLIKLIAIFFIPAAAMLLMGVLAYYNLIKLNKLLPISMFVLVTFIILVIVSWFSSGKLIFTLVSAFGFLLTVIYMGIDWIIIIKFNHNYKNLSPDAQSNAELIKWSMYFGYKLAWDFIYAVVYISELFKN